jgi:hypothetical protein
MTRRTPAIEIADVLALETPETVKARWRRQVEGGWEFRMNEGFAHVCWVHVANTLCGHIAHKLAPERAVPCETCLEILAERIAIAEE